jgi:hypothetical protein
MLGVDCANWGAFTVEPRRRYAHTYAAVGAAQINTDDSHLRVLLPPLLVLSTVRCNHPSLST